MKNLINKKVLVTTSNWFLAPDGKQYRAIHGTLKGVHEASKTLGFVPNRSHANWFIEIGEVIVMGCQIMYCIESEHVNTGKVEDWSNEGKEYERPTTIYVAS